MTKVIEDDNVNVSGLSKGEAIESLIKDHGYSYKNAEKYWKDHGARTKSTGFRADFYSALKDGASLTDKQELIEFMEVNGASDNDIKQYTHYLAIAKLVADVRKSPPEEITLDEWNEVQKLVK